MYHPICAPVPGNTTLRVRTVRSHSQMSDGILTLYHAFYQRTYTCAATGTVSRRHKSGLEALIFDVSSSLFVRHY